MEKNRKLITFAIPCYNSQDYMEKCIQSLLPGGRLIEIIIVDDGSTDDTPRIADEYGKKYPEIIRVIHQKNGGHGSAVNTGLEHARGKYYKVVDSDDWVDRRAYAQILKTLKRLEKSGESIDMLLSNYVYEKEGKRFKKVMRYGAMFPKDEIIGWEDVKRNIKGMCILMHSVTFRTQILRDCGLKLPRHTFYVDNLFVYVPMPYVRRMYYLDVDFYRYYIGREGQSVNEDIMVKRIDQQLLVNYAMINAYDLYEIGEYRLREYMFSYLEMITVISTMLGYVSNTPEDLKKVRKLWAYLKHKDKRMYRHIRFGMLGSAMNLPGPGGRRLSLAFYRLTQKIVGFN